MVKHAMICGVVASLVASAAFGFAACGKNDQPPDPPPAEEQAPPVEVPPPAAENNGEDTSESITREEKIVYDDGGVIITLKGFEEGEADKLSSWPTFLFLIENGSPENLKVRTTEASVNGIMVNSYMMCEVLSGEEAEAGMGLFSSGLRRANIEQIKDLEFIFHFIGEKSAHDYSYSDVVSIRTSVDDSYLQAIDDSGTVLLDSDGIKIIAQGLIYKYESPYIDLNLYIENNSGVDVRVREKSCSVNGIVFETFTEEVMPDGKKAFTALTFKKSELEENGIESIYDVRIVFEISESKSYSLIFDTEEILVAF